MSDEIDPQNCPACGHPMEGHRGRHCLACDKSGVECAALEGGVESLGG